MTDDDAIEQAGGTDPAQDDDLRAQLRAADPARSLTPLAATAAGRLLEDAMSDDPAGSDATGPGPARRDPARGDRPRRTTLLVAAAAVVIAGVGGLAWAVLGSDDGAETAVDAPAGSSAGPPAGPSTGSSTSASAGDSPSATPGTGAGAPATTVSIPRQGAARCMVPSAAVLAGQDLAVLATVRSSDDATVVLDVDRWYAGPPGGPETATVEVDAVEPSLQDLLLAPDLEPGQQYLVSATDGLVTLCGLSGPVTPVLAGLYDEAFG